MIFSSRENAFAEQDETQFQFPVDAVSFVGEDGNTSVEIYFGIPLVMVYWQQELLKFTGEVTYNMRIYDNDRNLVTESQDDRELLFYFYELEHIFNNDFYTASKSFDLKPGLYNIVIRISDKNSSNQSVFTDKLLVEHFSNDSLRISDFLIAYNISVEDTKKQFTRENVKLYHHPAHIYEMDRPIYFYFEIYNLFVADEQLRNNYRAEYAISPIKKGEVKKIALSRFVKNVSIEESAEEELWIASEHNNFSRSDFQFFRIDHHLQEEGEYLLSVRITDIISGMSVKKSTAIRIIK